MFESTYLEGVGEFKLRTDDVDSLTKGALIDVAGLVNYVAGLQYVREQLYGIEPVDVFMFLKAGGWKEDILTDSEANLRRLLWVAACKIKEKRLPQAVRGSLNGFRMFVRTDRKNFPIVAIFTRQRAANNFMAGNPGCSLIDTIATGDGAFLFIIAEDKPAPEEGPKVKNLVNNDQA